MRRATALAALRRSSDARCTCARNRAAQLHHARVLLRLHMRAWRSSAHGLYRERMHAELDARWSDAAQSEASKFTAVVARLEAELAAARCVPVASAPLAPAAWLTRGRAFPRSAALEREVAARTEAEERFKQAFMRGVCALNFEALSVLKSGAGSAGAELLRQSPIPLRM